MVFDKKGNIVSVDVPRPSSPELKKMLENEESRLKQISKKCFIVDGIPDGCTGVWADTVTILIKEGSGRI